MKAQGRERVTYSADGVLETKCMHGHLEHVTAFTHTKTKLKIQMQ